MKKLLYSAMALMLAGTMFTSCGTKGGGTTDPVATGPKLTFQTNTGTSSGYTFAPGNLAINTPIKIGVVITSDVYLKSTKMTVKFNNQAETIIGLDSTFSSNTKSCSRDYHFTLPVDKGSYTFTAYATDKDQTTTSIKLVIQAFGPLAERTTDTIFSLKAVGAGKFSAYDLLVGERITASGSANTAQRDIVDNSTSNTLGRSWKSQNGTTFVISGVDGKLNSKVYSQFQSEQDIIDAYNAKGGASTSINGVDQGMLIIAKSSNGGTDRYYLIAIDEISDLTGAEDDWTIFHYKE